MNILIIEDNQDILDNLKLYLEQNNYLVDTSLTIKETKEKNLTNYNLIILDITLPDGNGFNLYEQYILPTKTPTIFLTAKDSEEDIVKGLELGAEDYLTKPFSSKELLTRINKIILRTKKSNIIKVKDISFDIDKMSIKKNDTEIKLTTLELKILYLLFTNLNKVITRDTIIDNIWNWTGNDVNDNTVTVYINRIREKLNTDIIITIKGIGYRVDSND